MSLGRDIHVDQVRNLLLARSEIAILDVREEEPFAQEHPLWAANLPLSRLEMEALPRIPRLDVPIAVYGEHGGVDLAPLAVKRLRALGYSRARELDGGLAGWRTAGGELFRDVNVPSKAFGELVSVIKGTPSLSAIEVVRFLREASPVVVDVRPYDEYQSMNIPSAVSVPGGELVLRIRELVPDPQTPIVVNCAGRTRGIIGTQSLINAGVPNPVVALRDGTIGWTLAGQRLEHGAAQGAPVTISPRHHKEARRGAESTARRVGVRQITVDDLDSLDDPSRTVYRFDVRTEQEYVAGHLPGFRHAPGGQLVQETDHFAPVRGARLVLADADGVRATMTASWLAQMGWETYVVDSVAHLTEAGHPPIPRPEPPAVEEVQPFELTESDTLIVDLASGREYARGHVPGAWFAIRAQLRQALAEAPRSGRIVVTSPTGELARWAVAELVDAVEQPVLALSGGTRAWEAAGAPIETDRQRYLTAATDRYRRPYEGSDNTHEAMQAYLDWELGLVRQLQRDGTHFFTVI